MKYFMGIDLGTQSMKGVLFSPEGVILSSATENYIPDFPNPIYAEQDVTEWEKALKKIVGAVKEKTGITGEDIGMVAFGSQDGGIVPVDKDGKPLGKCILWLDRRAEDQCEAVRNKISDDEAFQLIGSSISTAIGCMKMLWIKNNQPEVYNQAKAFLEPGEYMVNFLSGVMVSDYAHASKTGLYDISKREWAQRMLDITGLSEKLIPVKSATDIAGNVKADIAEYIGLSVNTKVIVGTGDMQAAFVGSGMVGPGSILNIMGTAEVIATASDHVAYDPNQIMKPHLHANPKLWQIEQGGLISGAAVRWFKDNIAKASYEEMGEQAEKAPVGSDGLIFIPTLNGAAAPRYDDYAKGVFFGLTMGHTKAQITRAVFEGCAYGFRDNIESLREMGLADGDIIAGGGGTNSDFWLQIKADLIGKRIKTLKNPDSTPIGAGMLAGVAQGNFKNYEEAAKQLVEYDKVFEPNPDNKEIYDAMYQKYRDIFFTVEPLFEKYK